jgi:hypothetical protein
VRLIRVASTLLESGMLLAFGAMFVSGMVAAPEGEAPRLPMRLGLSAVPSLVVVAGYAAKRLTRPRGWAFAAACALVCSFGAALRPGLPPLGRLGDGVLGLLVGVIMGGLVMPLDDEADALIKSGSRPWRELFYGSLLAVFGVLPSVIVGGFVLALPTMGVGLWVLGRGLRYDLRQLVRGGGRGGAAARLLLGLALGLLGLGMAVVSPLFSFVRGPWSAGP